MAEGGIGTRASGSVVLPVIEPAPRCASIVAADPSHRKLGLQAAVAAMAADGVEPIWIGNPLNAPMTLSRLLVQLGAKEAGAARGEDDEACLAAAVDRRRDRQGRAVVVISQAETLDPAALPILQRLASGPDPARIVFVGTPDFWALLDGDALAPLRLALGRTASPVVQHGHPAGAGPAAPPEPTASSRRLKMLAWAVGVLAVLAALGGGGVAAVLAPGGLFYRATPQRSAYVIAAATAAATASASAVETRAPAVAPSANGSEGRVVIHYREGSAPGEVAANRLAVLASSLVARVQTRPVPNTPAAAAIRYFHPEDATRARELAVALRGPDATWDVRDFSSFRPLPSSGTVEVWIPSR